MKTKSFSTNPLYNRIREILTRSGVMYETYGRKTIVVHSGYLAGLIITPQKNYCAVQSSNFGITKKVAHGFSFCVNYSIETLFYKLYKFNIIDLVGYASFINSIDYSANKISKKLVLCH